MVIVVMRLQLSIPRLGFRLDCGGPVGQTTGLGARSEFRIMSLFLGGLSSVGRLKLDETNIRNNPRTHEI